jgi:glyoxylase-like metal-dependent hydrolase (beta-lactamase superfamily II)
MQTVSIGNVEVTPLLDTPILMNPEFFMPAYADGIREEYGKDANERGLLPMAITCFLVRSGGKTIIVDTGIGSRKRAGFPVGHLPERLTEAGISPSDIDVVIATHLHIDHVGWNTAPGENGANEIFFPRARFLFQQREWDHWMQPEFTGQPGNAHLAECVQPVMDSGQVELIGPEYQVDEHVTFLATPGHTPGHVSIGIIASGERGIIVGDASHHPVQLNHPDWSPTADTDPVLAGKTRDALFERAIEEQRTWFGGHWPYPGMGRIKRVEGRRVFGAL